MLKKHLLYLLIVCSVAFQITPVYAQFENKWVFGDGIGLDFNTGSSPSTFPTSIHGFGEGNASVCDNNGELLFYTEGDTVWNKNGTIMPHGNGLTGLHTIAGGTASSTSSCSQGALILPMADSFGKYYVFSLSSQPAEMRDLAGRLYYSVVDMNLNGGLGDVDPNRRGIFLDSGFTEQMTAVAGDECSIWLILVPIIPSGQSVDFKSFKVAANGVNPPVLSSTGIDPGYFFVSPKIAVSHDRKKLALTRNGVTVGGVELYDFDVITGMMSNQKILTPLFDAACYGICFSPDNTKLYVAKSTTSYIGPGGIFQYDITSNNTNTIINSEIIVTDSMVHYFSDLKLGSDGKIYYFVGDGVSIGSINSPDLPGRSCQPVDSAIILPAGMSYNPGGAGFTNAISVITLDSLYIRQPGVICADHNHNSLVLSAPLTPARYRWDDGSTEATRSVTEPGTYWVETVNYCNYLVDTFIVRKVDMDIFDFGSSDTLICKQPFKLKLDAAITRATSYLWQDGSTDSIYVVKAAGIYWGVADKNGCICTDTIAVKVVDVTQDLGIDTVICKDVSIQVPLNARIPEGASVKWSTGSTAAMITATDTGNYWVHISYEFCEGTDTMHISMNPYCECLLQIPSAFSPNGDGLNDVFHPGVLGNCDIHGYELKIYNRYGECVYTGREGGSDAPTGWDGAYEGVPAELGTYMYQLHFTGGTRQIVYQKHGDVTLIR